MTAMPDDLSLDSSEYAMSATKKTKTRRLNKTRKAGQARKKKLAKEGTTPSFPIHQAK